MKFDNSDTASSSPSTETTSSDSSSTSSDLAESKNVTPSIGLCGLYHSGHDACSTTSTCTDSTLTSCIINIDESGVLRSNKNDTDTSSTTVSLLSSSSNIDLKKLNQDEDEYEEILLLKNSNKIIEAMDKENNCLCGNSIIMTKVQDAEETETKLESFYKDYDGEVEKLVDKAAKLIENKCIGFGFYQLISFIFISAVWSIGNGWYAYVSVFTSHAPVHMCTSTPHGFNNFTYSKNQCGIIDRMTNQSVQCTEWTYDEDYMKHTIISEYNFVCDRDYIFGMAYSLEQTGYIFGTLLFSILADKIGRKPVLVSVLFCMTILGIIQYWIQNFIVYMVFGFIINFFASGLDSVCVPLVLEIVTTKQRTGYGIGMEYIWVIILTSLSGLAYLVNTWRFLRLTIFIILGVLAIASFWFVQESLTWLISTCRLDEALKIIERIAKINRLNNTKTFKIKKQKLFESFAHLARYTELTTNETTKTMDEKQLFTGNNINHVLGSKNLNIQNHKKGSMIAELIKYPKYRLIVLIMSLNWFATALIYDGLTYLNSFVGDNIFLNWSLLNIVELPAQFICYFTLSRYGRRMSTCISLIICGITLLLTNITFFEVFSNIGSLKLILFLIAKFTATQAYSAVILHSPELFPTHLRSFGYGICLFSSKVTSVISPIISLYLIRKYEWLPSVIYGVISIVCGFACLYVPETLNRPLPNSIEDVLKWPRSLTSEEKQFIQDTTTKINMQTFKRFKNRLVSCLKCKLKKNRIKKKSSPIYKIPSTTSFIVPDLQQNDQLLLNK